MGRESYQAVEPAQDCPLLAQSGPLGLKSPISREGHWLRSFSASNTQDGHRWQCLWGQQLRLSPRTNAEPLRPRRCAQYRAPRTGICSREVGLWALGGWGIKWYQ